MFRMRISGILPAFTYPGHSIKALDDSFSNSIIFILLLSKCLSSSYSYLLCSFCSKVTSKPLACDKDPLFPHYDPLFFGLNSS